MSWKPKEIDIALRWYVSHHYTRTPNYDEFINWVYIHFIRKDRKGAARLAEKMQDMGFITISDNKVLIKILDFYGYKRRTSRNSGRRTAGTQRKE